MNPALVAALAEVAPEILTHAVPAILALHRGDTRAARVHFREAEIHAERVAVRRGMQAAKAEAKKLQKP